MTTIKNFKDLIAWQEAHKLVLMTYLITKKFPDDEKYALTNQIRRCVVSVSSNIAEGFGRNSALEKSHFYSIARGSILELENQLLIARDLSYLKNESYDKFES
ncbi:MAG: four helix bundle protein [Candidatus Vogelbacteria bacterium CG22_combo_CG10-13_8_21_14_all_37_9]|uniref:Four helix bundle protein n=1 Tax=Candidatus Vogelbacteria bacterium CG22_combo_CG10-13_8_21_14_all_37_9 TaxID=1975046 RepID=A0A2H0BM64_9BACT|nr:MAG: hypothetical protein BK005_01040 [bacterium CG10_37_50]PIP58110.1 MAG: four helix bundle protein [Candidatus Vogelbacteria bacterium CG22_combo_CG10-13_8_21_14_all_37_9]